MTTDTHTAFPLGRTVATPGAVEALQRNEVSAITLLLRHAAGDWGELPLSDKEENVHALKTGARIMSSYTLADNTTVWIITDACDEQGRRNATTLLLPEEY